MGGASSIHKFCTGPDEAKKQVSTKTSRKGGLKGSLLSAMNMCEQEHPHTLYPEASSISSTVEDSNPSETEVKVQSIRELLDKESSQPSSFEKLIKLRGNIAFVEKYKILEDIQKKIFARMLMEDSSPDDIHQLDDIVSAKVLLTIDCETSPAIHTVFAKLYKFIYNYQASYERWIEILSTLEDELLLQIVGDYDDFISHHHDFDQHHHHRQFCAVMW